MKRPTAARITPSGSRVRAEAGNRTYKTCSSEEPADSAEAPTDVTDGYTLLYDANDSLEGCFVLRALAPDPVGAPLDSVVLRDADLIAIGDPFGSGVIPVDLVVPAP